MQRMSAIALFAGLTLALALPGLAQQRADWRDTFQSRVEILALLQSVNAEILAGASATRTLEEWCAAHRMAADPKIVAWKAPGQSKEPSAEQLERLAVRDASEVRYRHVELRCGEHVLSVADNWYVPGRLTPEMNALLETTDTPFGKAVQPLRPYRRTIAITLLWTPLPHGWEQQRQPRRHAHPQQLAIPRDLFQHRAVLYTADHLPFSEVVETYRSELFAFSRSGGGT
jgi:chorismate-pyruvate lyase